MNIETILFDLDGTILPMDNDRFMKSYLHSITEYMGHVLDKKTLLDALMNSMAFMIENTDQTLTNEAVFFSHFSSLVGTDATNGVSALLDDYYSEHFDIVKSATDYSKDMVDSVDYLKGQGYQLILATNPLLPKIATDKRIAWSGVDLEDFTGITRFETSTALKPKLAYYQEIIFQYGLNPETCLMVGNDVEEDLIAGSLGMKTWLVVDDLIHRGSDLKADYKGTRKEFSSWVKKEL